jgi:CrcB protein
MNLVLIAIGGATGSVARYIFSEIIIYLFPVRNFTNAIFKIFPWQTFFVNVLGSLLAGVLYYFIIRYFDDFNPRIKSLLLVGFLGGFTTFSAFSLDFFRLFTSGNYGVAFIYALSSITFSILALFLGFYLIKIFLV